MLAPVADLVQTAQAGTSTSFAWDVDPEADAYLVAVDTQVPVQVAQTTATVVAPAGSHTVSIAPALLATPAALFDFTVPVPPPPPPPSERLLPVLVGAGILGVAVLAAGKWKGARR